MGGGERRERGRGKKEGRGEGEGRGERGRGERVIFCIMDKTTERYSYCWRAFRAASWSAERVSREGERAFGEEERAEEEEGVGEEEEGDIKRMSLLARTRGKVAFERKAFSVIVSLSSLDCFAASVNIFQWSKK